MNLIKKYGVLFLMLLSLILNAAFLFYILNAGFFKNSRGYSQDVKISNELENKLSGLDLQYKDLQKKYKQLEKSKNGLQLKNDDLTKAFSSNKKELYNNLIEEKNGLLDKNILLKDELEQYKSGIAGISGFLAGIDFKKDRMESDLEFISRCIKSFCNDSAFLKDAQAGKNYNEQKLNRIIDALFSLSDINGIITGKNTGDIIINANKLDYILKNATFITYESDRDHACGIIEIMKINDRITYKVIKGSANEKNFF